jgi:hypothetical protein
MNIQTRYTAPLVVVLSALSLAAAPAALASQIDGASSAPAHQAALDRARNSVPVTLTGPTSLHGAAGKPLAADSKAPAVVLSHAAQAHAGGSQYLTASQPPQSGSSGSNWNTAGVVLVALAIVAAIAGGIALLVGATTRTRRRHPIGSH